MRRVIRKFFRRRVFERKVVLLSGAAAGIGRALAERFAQAGASLVLLDLDQALLDGLARHLSDHHNAQSLALRCDVADPGAVQAAVALALERFGGIDLLVNCAAVAHSGTFADTAPEVFERDMAVNYFGALHCTRAALPSLLARRGQIVVLSSLSGILPLPGRSAYNASKHALEGLFETLRLELRGSGVNVLRVYPGFTASELRERALLGRTAPPLASQPLSGRLYAAQETAEAIYRAVLGRRALLVHSRLNRLVRLLARLAPRLCERWLLPRLVAGRRA